MLKQQRKEPNTDLTSEYKSNKIILHFFRGQSMSEVLKQDNLGLFCPNRLAE